MSMLPVMRELSNTMSLLRLIPSESAFEVFKEYVRYQSACRTGDDGLMFLFCFHMFLA